MDLGTMVTRMRTDGTLQSIATNPLTQFGTRSRPRIGARFLPERPVLQNAYREENVQYRTLVANSGTRYSPVQLKQSGLVGSMLVELAESDIGSILTSREYDILRTLLRQGGDMAAVAQAISFLDITVNRPLSELNEKQRWQAIVLAAVTLTGDNEYLETVPYSNPAGHRAASGGVWSNNSYDPYTDIFGMVQKLKDKGFTVGSIITSGRVVSILGNNDKVKTRTGRVTVSATGQIQSTIGRGTLADLNSINSADGIPPFETYDEMYRTQAGTGRFIPDNVMIFIATTGRDEAIDLGDAGFRTVPNTLGYVGVGVPAGQDTPGRVIIADYKDDKPPRVEAQGWQTSLPVILEPEAIAVITGIA